MGFSSLELRLFLSLLLIYATFMNYGGWDAESRFSLTLSLVNNHSIRTNGYHELVGDRAIRDGNYYSEKFPGPAVLATPSYLLYKAVFGPIGPSAIPGERHYIGGMYLATLSTSSLFMALGAIMFFRLLLLWTQDKRMALYGTILLCLGTTLFSQATMFLGHAVATAMIITSLYLLVMVIRGDQSKPRLIFAGLLAGFSFICDPLSLPFIPLLFIYLLLKKRGANQPILFAVGILLGLLPAFVYFSVSFGHPLKSGYDYIDYRTYLVHPTRMALPTYSQCIDQSSFNIDRMLSNLPFYRSTCTRTYTVLYDDGGTILNWTSSKGDSQILIRKGFQVGEEVGNLYAQVIYLPLMDLEIDRYVFSVVDSTDGSISRLYESDKISDVPSDWALLRGERRGGLTDLFEEHGDILVVDPCGLDGLRWENEQGFEIDCPIALRMPQGDIYATYSAHAAVSPMSAQSLDGSRERTAVIRMTIPLGDSLGRLYLLPRLLLFPHRGLLFFSPAIIMSIPGVLFLWRRRRIETLLLVASVVSVLWLNASLPNWWGGGSSFGARHLSTALPFLVLAAVFGIKKVGWRIAWVLLGVSVAIQLVGIQHDFGPQLQIQSTANEDGDFFITKSEVYYQELSTLDVVGPPQWTFILDSFIRDGPRSVVLENYFGGRFRPFLNIFFLSILLLFLWTYGGRLIDKDRGLQ